MFNSGQQNRVFLFVCVFFGIFVCLFLCLPFLIPIRKEENLLFLSTKAKAKVSFLSQVIVRALKMKEGVANNETQLSPSLFQRTLRTFQSCCLMTVCKSFLQTDDDMYIFISMALSHFYTGLFFSNLLDNNTTQQSLASGGRRVVWQVRQIFC